MPPRVVAWFSCGAASAVATKLALAEFGEVDIVYTKVMEEHPDNLRFLKDCEKWFDQTITITMDEYYGGSIYNVFEKQYMRTPNGAPCSRDLKKRVRVAYQRTTDICILGYTVEEKDRIDQFVDANNDVNFYPILAENNITKENCLALIDRAGIELPVMYHLGYPHNNCVGCVKGGMGYWNKIRVDFPAAFNRMAAFEREKGYTVLKDKNGPVYLDALDPNRGRLKDEPPIQCGMFCEYAESKYLKE